MNSDSDPATFGAWVRLRRRQLDLTQAELGQRAGCSAAAIRKIEADERKPSRQLADLLAQALAIPADELDAFLQAARGLVLESLRAAPAGARSALHNLPTLLTSTVDRAHDLQIVTRLLREEDAHLVTLVGPPGIGKTRLSIHCGNELLDAFADGVWFVDLAEIDHAEFFVSALARSLPTLGLPPSPELPQLLSGLRERSLLLILDNFEHVVDRAALEAAQILKTYPKVRMLVTSRVPLHVYGEHEYPLPPLSVPPATVARTRSALLQYESVQLFCARVRQHQPGFEISPEAADAILAICATLEGIPLALELAAATLRQIPLGELAPLLRRGDWLGRISTPHRDLPPRQRTVENVIDWSYTLLPDSQREFFCKLGVFSTWFDAEVAAAINETESAQTSALLVELADQSLLVREIVNGKVHWRLLELLREYANSRQTPDQREHLYWLCARHYLARLGEFEHTSPRAEADRYFQIHASNIHTVLKWVIHKGHADLSFSLMAQMEAAWSSLGYFKEELDLTRQALKAFPALDPSLRAGWLGSASDLAWQLHDFDLALSFSEEAVNLGRAHGLANEYPWYLNRLGRIYIEQGRLVEARLVLTQALDLARVAPSAINPGILLAQLGEVALFESRLEEAEALFEQALPLLDNRDGIFLALTRTDLAEVALAHGDIAQAQAWLMEAYEPASQHVRRWMVWLLALTGWLALSERGDKRLAAGFHGAIETLTERTGVVLAASHREVIRQRMDRLQLDLSSADWQAAFEAGRQWSRDDVSRLARAALGITK